MRGSLSLSLSVSLCLCFCLSRLLGCSVARSFVRPLFFFFFLSRSLSPLSRTLSLSLPRSFSFSFALFLSLSVCLSVCLSGRGFSQYDVSSLCNSHSIIFYFYTGLFLPPPHTLSFPHSFPFPLLTSSLTSGATMPCPEAC